MSRTDKNLLKLEVLESEFESELVADLRHVEGGRDSLYFIVEELAPSWCRRHWLSESSANRWAQANAILDLRTQLGLTTDDTPAQTFRDTVIRYGEMRPHDLGPTRLAAKLLGSLAKKSH